MPRPKSLYAKYAAAKPAIVAAMYSAPETLAAELAAPHGAEGYRTVMQSARSFVEEATERVREQALGVEARGLDALLREVALRPAQQLEHGPRPARGGAHFRLSSSAFFTPSSSSPRSPSRICSRRCSVMPAR